MTPRQILLYFGFTTAAAFSAVGSGCTTLAPDCAQNWYDAGQRDGRYGAQARDVQYAASCGTRFDTGRYVAGWQAGYSARPPAGGM
jgi:hypothetical protein